MTITNRFLFLILVVFVNVSAGQNYQLAETEIFQPQKKKILVFEKNPQSKKLLLFYSRLRVNTDGSPKSYHPNDFNGETIALNNICNGIFVYRKLPQGKETQVKCAETKEVLARFKANNWVEKEQQTYRINWQDVIADRNGKPCIFQEGVFKGYFGSQTSVKNGLPALLRGECGHLNELDSLVIPNLVLPRKLWTDKQTGKVYTNPLQKNDSEKEDLVFAYNPKNNKWSYAILGDIGPADNLGEGSIALNMKLLDKVQPPVNYKKAIELDTGENTKIIVVIIPASKDFRAEKPYTLKNIEKRGRELIKELGFSDEQKLIEFLINQKPKF